MRKCWLLGGYFWPATNRYLVRILSSPQTSHIYKSLPARSRLEPWALVYSLSRDGCSLNNLRTKLSSAESNILLVIEVSSPSLSAI